MARKNDEIMISEAIIPKQAFLDLAVPRSRWKNGRVWEKRGERASQKFGEEEDIPSIILYENYPDFENIKRQN